MEFFDTVNFLFKLQKSSWNSTKLFYWCCKNITKSRCSHQVWLYLQTVQFFFM